MILVFGSFIFYMWGSLQGVLILLLTTLIDYHLAKYISSSRSSAMRKVLLGFSILANTGVLIYFKYAYFFVHEFNLALSFFNLKPLLWEQVILPMGISFIIFHKISYVMDIFSNKSQPADSLLTFTTYVVMFPKLLQGPIIRYHNISGQLKDPVDSPNDLAGGLFRFGIGLGKKVLIADVLGEIADKVFQCNLSSLTPGQAWLGIFCYTLQIYFDFSGYSDMAIGLGTMLGFRFQENFNRPYLSRNFTEFWKRWHISLSDWFKEYLYIPIGGNRVSRIRKYLNLWIVFFVSGLWHGANWTFIVWGAYHGFFLLADKLFLTKSLQKFGRIFNVTFTFLLVMLGWVFFRSENVYSAIQYLGKLSGFFPQTETSIPILMTDLITNRGMLVILLAAFLSFFPESVVSRSRDMLNSRIPERQMYRIKIICLFLLTIFSFSALANNSFRPFIYLRF